MTSKTFPIWIVMDEVGGYEVAADEAEALDRWKYGDDFVVAVVRGPTAPSGTNVSNFWLFIFGDQRADW